MNYCKIFKASSIKLLLSVAALSILYLLLKLDTKEDPLDSSLYSYMKNRLNVGDSFEISSEVSVLPSHDGTFSISQAAKLWDEKIGCDSFKSKHRDLIELYSKGGPDKWPKSQSFQDWSLPHCDQMKLRHVSIHVAKPAWLVPNWLDGIHVCQRCGLTCQFSWSETLADIPDAQVYVERNRPPLRRNSSEPLRVYLSLEPSPWTNQERSADIGVGFSADKDIQSTYARPRESRQHYIAPEKRQDVLLFRATSNCLSEWRNELVKKILSRVPHHSFGACDNNVGGRGRELEFYPHCRFMPGSRMRKLTSSNLKVFPHLLPVISPNFVGFRLRGANVEWQEIGHCVLSHYKFTLAVENTRIPGYVTEKIFTALESGTVPIYYGADDVSEFVPPESYIDGYKFNSTESLVDFLQALHIDPVAYMNYFAWRRCGVVGHLARSRSLSLDSLPCRLCEKISALGGKQKSDL